VTHPTLADIIAALPYLTLEERGRLRYALIRPIPKPAKRAEKTAETPIMDTVSILPGKTLKLREGSGH
jgi:hypothetical protein